MATAWHRNIPHHLRSTAKAPRALQRRELFALVGGPLLLLACSKRQAAPRKRRVSLIMKSLANEFFQTMLDAAKQHQASHATQYELLASGTKDERDVTRQVALVLRAIEQRVDAIVIAPADSKALVPVCKQALEENIVVVNIDNKLDAELLGEKNFSVAFVGPNNRKGARLVGEHLARALRPGDAVAILEGAKSTYNGIERKRGFEEAIKQAGLNLVSSRSANWESDQAELVTAALLREHPGLRGILAANDSMAVGAANTLRAAGKAGDVLLVGFDNTSAASQLLREGRMLATVDQYGNSLATFGIEFALEILSSNAIPADRETPVKLITR